MSIKFKKDMIVNTKCLSCNQSVTYNREYNWSPHALKCPICGDGKNILIMFARPKKAN